MNKRTALYDWHKRRGARLIEFAGWEMPVQYSGIVREHQAVRQGVGVFDISHMGQIFVSGESALPFLQNICTNDISKCAQGRAMYSHLLNDKGGVIDDIFVYCLKFPSRYLVVVNAATTEKDHRWMTDHAISGAELQNESDQWSMVAVQGPKGVAAISKIFPKVPERHRIFELDLGGETAYLCRTGYTGEDGFEIVAPNAQIENLAERIMTAGSEFGIIPCGLGSRDTLRLEAGYLLYGNDMDEDHSPVEAGVSWVVKFEKKDFIGKDALKGQMSGNLKQKLTAFKLLERGIPRHGSQIFRGGRAAGLVTSGTFSPTLQTGIALGYLPTDASGAISIECRGKPVPAQDVNLPFYSGSKNAAVPART